MRRYGLAWKGGIQGGIIGPRAVPLAELETVIVLLQSTRGRLLIATDCDYIIKGFNPGPQYRHPKDPCAWRKYWGLAADRRSGVMFCKVKSHPYR